MPTSAFECLRRLLTRVVLVLVGASVLGYLVGGMVLIAVSVPRALAGSVNWWELAFGPLHLIPCVLIGVLFGLIGSSWWLAPLSGLTVAAWVLVAPIVLGGLLPSHQYSVGHEFLFPGTPAFRHEPYAMGPFALMGLMWVLLSACVISVLRLVARVQSGDRVRAASLVVLGALAVALIGTFVMSSRPFYGQLPRGEMTCADSQGWEFCVADEEADVLPDLVTGAQDVIERAGPLASVPHRVISVTVWVWDGLPDSFEYPTIVASVSNVAGAQNAHLDIATTLSGLDQCGAVDESNSDGIENALALAGWLVEDQPYISALNSASRWRA